MSRSIDASGDGGGGGGGGGILKGGRYIRCIPLFMLMNNVDGIHTYDCDSHARLTSYDGRMKIVRAGPVAPPSTGITDDLTYGL